MTANENVVQQGGVGNANSWDLDHEWPEEHWTLLGDMLSQAGHLTDHRLAVHHGS